MVEQWHLGRIESRPRVVNPKPLRAIHLREFEEETGVAPSEPFHPLGSIKQKAGKVVHAWAFEGDGAAETMRSITIRVEWPRGSGRLKEFPEIDRAEWFRVDDARTRINPAQVPFLDHLVELIKG